MHDILYKVRDIWIEKENKKKRSKSCKPIQLVRRSSTFDIQAELIHRP